MYYAFFNVGIGGTKVTDAALIAALNAVTFAASIKLYSLYGEFFYPVTGFTQFSIEYDSDKDAAGSIWEYGDTNNQYPYIVRYDKVGTFLALNEAQSTDIYYATYGGIKQYDGMEKVTVTIPLEENKAVSLTAPGETEITPTSGNAGMEKVTVTPVLQDKTITENGTYSADSGNAGLGEVTVAVPLEANKAVSITENGTVEIEPSSGKTAMEKVTATVAIPFILYGFLWDSAVLLAKQLVRKPGTYDVLKNNEAVQMAVDSDLSLANTATVSIPEGINAGKYGTKYINGKFFICTTKGLFVSQDGASWTQVHTGIVCDIIYFKGNYYAERAESSVIVLYKSADLNTWEKLTDTVTGWSGMLASDGNVLIFGVDDNFAPYAKYSFDGEVWADCQGMRNSGKVRYLPGIGFFSTGRNKEVDYSADGITWTTVLTASNSLILRQCEDCCVALETNNTTGYYTKNGTTWTSFTIPYSAGSLSSQRTLLKRDGKYYLTIRSCVYVTADDFKTLTEIPFPDSEGKTFVENCMNDWGVPLVVSGEGDNVGMRIYALDSTDTPQQLYSGNGSYSAYPITADGKLILPYANNAIEVMYADVTVQLLATIGADTYPLVRDSARDVEF
ncbi:MAG: hypothetical protein II863_03035 [Kiritimatiellae bacterium]|nr:hypothetical protein [Kiritimatiellia bacterium]